MWKLWVRQAFDRLGFDLKRKTADLPPREIAMVNRVKGRSEPTERDKSPMRPPFSRMDDTGRLVVKPAAGEKGAISA
jgi:hypothetical protein